ncbi:MAG: hypothetical protein NC033_01900 [Clostridiales bacterium]|nr:hypothetical protein [Clostridiales bacterium]
MADEEKEQNGQSEQQEDKKEGKVSGFFKKLGKKLDDATYDMRLQSDFDKSHKKYTVYAGTSVLSSSPEIAVEEHLDENYLLTLDDDEAIAAGNLIEDSDTGDVMHIAAVEKTTFTVEFEGKSNEKPALKIFLGEMAQKVDVIKVGNDFYLK